MSNVPGDLDLLIPWFDIVRAMRAAGMSSGYTVLTLRVLCDEHGRPVHHSTIGTIKLSPLSKKQAFETFLEEFSD